MHAIKYFFLSALTLLLFSCSGDSPQRDEKQKGSTAIDNSDFYIAHPADWVEDQSGKLGTSFFLFAPADNDTDPFRENVNLLIQDLKGKNMDLDQFVTLSEDQISTHGMPNSELISSERISSSNDEYHKMIYTGDQSGEHLQFEAYCWVRNEKAYVLTFSAEQTTFKKYQSTAENILNSFKLK